MAFERGKKVDMLDGTRKSERDKWDTNPYYLKCKKSNKKRNEVQYKDRKI